MYGARKAEELNYRYFLQGRHTPMAILLSNAELSADSEAALTDYAKGVEGVDNAHKFLIIETVNNDLDNIVDDNKPKASVELKPLAELLQKDALFLDYDESSRKKVQSSFGLPDLYVGRTTDFNRATADTARAITEEQGFEPERNSIEWVINNKLFLAFELKWVVMAFKKPEIANTEDFVALVDRYIAGHAITPNDLREHAAKTLNKELEPFGESEADQPIGLIAPQASPDPFNLPNPIAKSEESLVGILKSVRDALEEIQSERVSY